MILCSQQITQHKVLSTDCALKEYSHLKQNIGAYLSFGVEIIVLQEKKKKKIKYLISKLHIVPQDTVSDQRSAKGALAYGPLIKVQITPKNSRCFKIITQGGVTLSGDELGGEQEPRLQEP